MLLANSLEDAIETKEYMLGLKDIQIQIYKLIVLSFLSILLACSACYVASRRVLREQQLLRGCCLLWVGILSLGNARKIGNF